MTRVLIADDQELVRTGFRRILEGEGDLSVVGEAADGRQAVQLARDLAPDVVLMDIRMPAMDGLEATRKILSSDADTRVIILTTFDLDQYVYAALSAGASGFLLKDVTPEQLVAAVRLVRAGDALLAPTITRRLVERFASRDSAVLHRDLSSLTPRELEVLKALALIATIGFMALLAVNVMRPLMDTWRFGDIKPDTGFPLYPLFAVVLFCLIAAMATTAAVLIRTVRPQAVARP